MSCATARHVEFVFGGTFDPVHLGHLAIIDHLRQHFPQISVRILLCALPPLKSQPQTRYAERLEMLQLAMAERSGVIIDTREQLRQKPSYTIDSLRQLAEELPTKDFILVMGMDSLASLQQWHEWQSLANSCHIAVFNRPGSDGLQAAQWMREAGFKPVSELQPILAERSGYGLLLNMAEKKHSSSDIREAIRQKLSLDSLLTQSVIDYISHHHLYESENI